MRPGSMGSSGAVSGAVVGLAPGGLRTLLERTFEITPDP